MTIFKTAYATTACRGFVLRPIEEAIEKARALGYLHPPADLPFAIVTGSSAFELAIPSFAHPFLTADDQLLVDMRPVGRWDQGQARFNVRNPIEYNLAALRGKLNYIWLGRDPAILRDLSPLPLAVYCDWVAKTLARRFALSAREGLDLAIYTGWFYLSLFSDEVTLSEREHNSRVQMIARQLRAPASDVFTVVDKIGTIPLNLPEYCKLAHEVVGSVRLAELNAGVVLEVLGGSWFGNHRETLAVALEHPPTWLTLMLTAATDRGFKTTGIADIMNRFTMAQQTQFAHALSGVVATLATNPAQPIDS